MYNPGTGNNGMLEMTRAEILDLADRESREMLGVPQEEAFRMLDAGDLEGTIAEAELHSLRFLLQGE